MIIYSMMAFSKGNLRQFESNILVEVFALHLRNLDEFFGRKQSNSDYMKPEHFVEWRSDYRSNPEIMRRASHEISHLTYDRKAPGEKEPWDAGKYFEPIRKECIRFLELVSENKELLEFQNNRTKHSEVLSILRELTPIPNKGAGGND